MKIIVCIKQVPEKLEQSLNNEKVVERTHGNLVINEFDRYAIEAALRIKEKCGAEIIALSMGNQKAESALRDAVAMGVDRTILLTDKIFAGSDTQATTYILSQAIKKLGRFELVLCGRQSSDGDTAQVGPQLSEKLGAGLVTNVSKIILEDGKFFCEHLMDGLYIRRGISLPTVITVNRSVGEPRIPTIRNIVKSQQALVVKWTSSDLSVQENRCGSEGSPTKVDRVTKSRIIKKEPIVIVGSPEQQAKKILSIISKNYKKDLHTDEEEFDFDREIIYEQMDIDQVQNTEIWIFGEQKKGKIIDVTWEIASKCKEIYKESRMCCLILLHELLEKDIEKVVKYGIRKVYILHTNIVDADVISQGEILSELLDKGKPNALIMGATDRGRSLAPWVASRLKTGITADCIDLRMSEENRDELIQIRPAFSGNLIAEIRCPEARPQIATIRQGMWKKKYCKGNYQLSIIQVQTHWQQIVSTDEVIVSTEDDFNISNSNFIIEGGRGALNGNGFEKLKHIAKVMNGSIGATRVAVDAQEVDYKYQIGQTGAIVRPQVCVAVGISGALEHIVGIRGANVLIAINIDENAPIFNYADYKVVANAEVILQKICDELSEMEGNKC